MLNENIKAIRKSKGLSQEELAIKLNVVRQTISKWEQGLSVPDSDMLISISEVLETPVSTLLGETISESKADDLRAISEKLEVINLQLAQRKQGRQKAIHWFFIFLCVIIVIAFAVLILLNLVDTPPPALAVRSVNCPILRFSKSYVIIYMKGGIYHDSNQCNKRKEKSLSAYSR